MTSTLVQCRRTPNVLDNWNLVWVIGHSHLELCNSSSYTPTLHRLGLVHNHWTASSSSLGVLAPHTFYKLEILV